MTRRRSRSSRTNQGLLAGGCGAAVVLVAGIILALTVLFSGEDPAGLFEEPEPPRRIAAAPPPQAGSGGNWWRVYFTDPERVSDPEDLAGSIPGILIEHIAKAQRSIHIAAFAFDLEPVAQALIAARGRGVEVLWITDDEYGLEEDEDTLGLFQRMEEAGIEVRDDGRSELMHNKFLIFDDATVWTGSTNLTENGNFRNNNNVLVVDSPRLAAVYEAEFREMWRGEFGASAPSAVADQALTIDGTPLQVLFAAEDQPVSALVPLVEGAQESIDIMAFSFTHDELGAAVIGQARAGLAVRGVFESRSSETEHSELVKFFCAGVPVRQDGNPGAMHHKVIVIDGRIVITGSANFSNSADRFNEENVIVVANQDIASAYLREFERVWAQGMTPTDLDC